MFKATLKKFFVVFLLAMSFLLGRAVKIQGDGAAYAKNVQSAAARLVAQLPVHPGKILQPDELYHKVWYLIKDEFYDQTFNGQAWGRWEHRYDGKLKTADDAH